MEWLSISGWIEAMVSWAVLGGMFFGLVALVGPLKSNPRERERARPRGHRGDHDESQWWSSR